MNVVTPTDYDGAEARLRFGRRPAVVKIEETDNAESDELTEWRGEFPSHVHL